MDAKLRVVHYTNQFFGDIGGEEQARHPVEIKLSVVRTLGTT